jgi:hypothetical protein
MATLSRFRPMMKVMPNANHPLLGDERPHMTEEKLRKWLKHPTAGGFPAEGPAQWPRDKFTFARIQDGDVVVVEGDVGSKTPGKPAQIGSRPAAAAPSQPVAQPTNKPQTAERQQS